MEETNTKIDFNNISFEHSIENESIAKSFYDKEFDSDKSLDAYLSLKPRSNISKKQEIFYDLDESEQNNEKKFSEQNEEVEKIVLRNSNRNFDGISYIFSDFKEYVGEILDLDTNKGTFLGTFSELIEPIPQTSEFDIDQLENITDRDSIEVGRRFLMIVGKKRKVIVKRNGERNVLGEQNFYRITLRPKITATLRQEKEIDEISSRWRKLFAN